VQFEDLVDQGVVLDAPLLGLIEEPLANLAIDSE
jgi:hypothetical protein